MQQNDLALLREKLTQSRKHEESVVPNFLRKTYEMLEREQFNDIISWSDDGRALVIKNPTLFAEKVLPLYFKHNNLASYIRQLNMYNFKKRKTHLYENTFVHEKFIRGEKDLLAQIKRKGTDIMSMLAKVQPQLEEPSVSDSSMSLIQENRTLKYVQKTMSEKIQSLEKKLGDINKMNELLFLQIQMLTSSGNSGSSHFSMENLLTDFSRKITQGSNFATSSVFAANDIFSKFMKREATTKTMNWSPLQSLGSPASPKEFKFDDVLLSLNSDKAKVNYFDNLLNIVSKLGSNGCK